MSAKQCVILAGTEGVLFSSKSKSWGKNKVGEIKSMKDKKNRWVCQKKMHHFSWDGPKIF